MNNDLKNLVKNADHVERVSSNEYVITIVDAREIENKITVKKFLSGFTCQWSMSINGTVWVMNENIDDDVKKFFDWCSDKAFDFSDDENNADRNAANMFFANLT